MRYVKAEDVLNKFTEYIKCYGKESIPVDIAITELKDAVYSCDPKEIEEDLHDEYEDDSWQY